jgi:hypothetical protein
MGFREDVADIFNTSPDKLRRHVMGISWDFEYTAPAEHGWLIRATNRSAFAAQLDICELEFYMREGAVPRLDYLTAPFVNPEETIDLKFSVKFDGKAQTDGGKLGIGILLPSPSTYAEVRYGSITLPDLRVQKD